MTAPRIVIARGEDHAAGLAGDSVEALVRSRPDAVLALPTGRTPIPLYDDLSARYRAGRIDFSAVRTFNLDEWVGLAADQPGSYARFMAEHLYARVNLRPENCFIPDGVAPDLAAECHRYEDAIRAAGGIDLAILGIGRNGHIGFNEPGTPLESRTHLAVVAEDTRRANAYSFPTGETPRLALTMGVATILAARAILLIATGPAKAGALARALGGPVDAALPASALQRHPNVTIVGDAPALAGLGEMSTADKG